MSDHITVHPNETLFCPDCGQQRTGRVEEHDLHGVVAWSCPVCGFADDIGRVPVDAEDR